MSRHRLITFLLVAVFPACSRTVHIPVPTGTLLKVVVWHHNVATGFDEPKEVFLQPNTSEYRRLQDWITRNQKGWYPSFAPTNSNGIFIHAGDLHLRFNEGTVSVFTGKGDFHKEVREGDYAFLKPIAGIKPPMRGVTRGKLISS